MEQTTFVRVPAGSPAAVDEWVPTEGPVETYHDMPVQTLDLDPSDPDYYQKALETELYNYKLIRNVPTAYQAESWDAYTATANTLLNIDPDNIDDVSKSMIDNAVAQREALVQDAPAADCMWYIWGDAPATAETVEVSDFTAESYDNADMKPFLVPYLVEDQLAAKGNMIVIAGDGWPPTARKIPGWICSGLSGICDIMPTAWGWAVWTVSPPAASRAVRAPSWEKWPTCMAMFSPPCMMQIMPPTQWIR